MILEHRLQKLKTQRDEAVAAAKKKATDAKKSAKDIKKASSDAERPFKARVILIEKATQELQGHDKLTEDQYDEALALFKKAGSMETEFVTAVKLKAGKTDEAIKDAEKNVDSHKNEVRPLSSLVETLWTAGKKKKCREAFKKLRTVGHMADIDVPALARLAPIAREFGWDQDWRAEVETPDDVGDRPSLESLGPFRWRPSPASGWTLTDSEGKQRSLSDYQGKPVVVIFYLGFGCLHCAEQLQEFAPMTKKYEEAGLSVIAISTDKQKDLIESRKNYEDGSFPFPLVSDEKLEVFRKWRVFDDFEQIPLHGTFLIDGEGLVRWHDISYEPFKDPKFVLNEAKRLLKQRSTRVIVDQKQLPADEPQVSE